MGSEMCIRDSFSPSGFRRRPRWGQLKPSGALPVGGDFIAQQETPVKGAAHGFAATPLTGISRCAFCESPTEQIAQRACSRHEPTRWREATKKNPVRAHLYTTLWHRAAGTFPRKGALTYHRWWFRASSVPSESAIQPFANLAICKRSIAPKVFSPFEALASIGKIYTLRVIFARLLGVLRPLKPQKKRGCSPRFFSLLRQHFPGVLVTRSGLSVRCSDIPGFLLPGK